MSVAVRALTGADLHAALDDLATLRITVFAAYPYLYAGSAEYEREYLTEFTAAPAAVLVAAFDGARIVGAATASPLIAQDWSLATALSQPHLAWAKLFQLRAAGLVGEPAPTQATERLSGTLIGLDLGAARANWLGQQVLIVGAPRLAALYDAALRLQGAAPVVGDADAATRAGLWSAWQAYRKDHP